MPLQACLSVLQPPLPLHSFMPLQPAFSPLQEAFSPLQLAFSPPQPFLPPQPPWPLQALLSDLDSGERPFASRGFAIKAVPTIPATAALNNRMGILIPLYLALLVGVNCTPIDSFRNRLFT